MIKYVFLILGVVSSALSLSAAPYTASDFTYSAMLSKAETSIREINVPPSLYEKMQRRDYGDLRVLSAEGQIVPHQFINPDELKDAKNSQPLVFYPFNKEQSQNPNHIQVVIKQKGGEQSLRINQSSSAKQASKNNEYQYIIENKKRSPSLCQMTLAWKQSKPSAIISFKLEGSNKLQNWRSLSRKLTVSKLNYAGSQLVHDTVKFSCTTQKYLRLTWLKPEQQTTLLRLVGIYSTKAVNKTQWTSFGKPGYKPNNGKNNKSLYFESNLIASLSKLELVAPQDGLFYRGTLYSRNNEKSPWRFRKEINQYRLNMGGTLLKSNPMSIQPTSDQFWKIDLNNESLLTDSQLPQIRAGWMPKKLYFLAQGEGPFNVVFGNANVAPAQTSDLKSLVDSLKQSGTAPSKVSVGEVVKGNIVIREKETDWKVLILWFVLIIGTMLMGLMAFRLFKQMGAGD